MTPDTADELVGQEPEMLTAVAKFMIHLRTHGWAYAIGMVLADQSGAMDALMVGASQCL
jgi:hypothetical protein